MEHVQTNKGEDHEIDIQKDAEKPCSEHQHHRNDLKNNKCEGEDHETRKPCSCEQHHADIPATVLDASMKESSETVHGGDCPQSQKGLSNSRRIVRNMTENFQFFHQAVDEIVAIDDDDTETGDRIGKSDLAERFKDLTISTAYSGVGAPEATAFIIREELQKVCDCKLPAPEVLHQIEFNAECRAMLGKYNELSGAKDACCFGDMNAFYVDQLHDTIQGLQKKPELALEVLSKMIASGEAVKTSAYCYTHDKMCHVKLSLVNWRFRFFSSVSSF